MCSVQNSYKPVQICCIWMLVALLPVASVVAEGTSAGATTQATGVLGIDARLFAILSLVAAVFASIAYIVSRRTNTRLKQEIDAAKLDLKKQESLERKIAQIERMDSLGMLAGGIAHDFNNLLLGVLCNAEVLKSREFDDELTNDCVDGIIRSAQTAADLSHKMLTYSGKRHSDKTQYDVCELIRDSVPLLRSGLGAEEDFRFECPDEPAIAEIDPTQIEQVLLNLFSNAMSATDNADRVIELRVGKEKVTDVADDPNLFGQRTEGGKFVFVEVTDNGIGIPPAVIKRMFEPFFTTRPDGRGLGLSVVYGYVNKHDGLVRVTSQVGKGTTIRVLLPECAEPNKNTGTSSDLFFQGDNNISSPAFDHQLQSAVLVVDDEPSVVDVIQRLLRRQGIDSEQALGGQPAIDYMLAQQSTTSCVVLDLVMPTVDGDMVLKWMQANGLDLPVILMTGYSQKNLDEYVEHPNVVEVLEKPFSRQRLIDAIYRACEMRLSSDAQGPAESRSSSPR